MKLYLKKIKNMPKLRIALLMGGISGERKISLKTGAKIYTTLDKNKYEICKYDPKHDLKIFINDTLNKKFDLVFPALHGPFGEDGRLQGMLDMMGMPYVFSGCLASALAMDKAKAKIIARNSGINVGRDIILNNNDSYNIKKIIKKLSLPIFIKPLLSGSSVGISMAKNDKDLQKGILNAFKFGNKILLEEFINGRELTVPIIGNPPESLPVIEIKPKISQWFDYKAKYKKGGTEEICPAHIPNNIKKEIQLLGIKIFKAVGCKDLARADFIWSKIDNKLYFLEINTIPGMTDASLTPQSAKVAGLDFGQFLDKLIETALNNKNV
ncbi:D-alanine--D-alanine ligase [Candidatus Falkowbacteria bacterium CG_4_9_14_3_um_filter_36_9]|uniref:D-alanine--D-alanine ligase n=1 Tax=Candidatus Falkowbacteria bacterium CG02_land_8_20_14_3_00_36_14 TaxID=1974560 RepID=A0A2M7DPJ4_9BACT|nr:MAG: D-alanine--D-alanine ligase [Candidatus Falkowbacteria bacterium CG02_land_8_20_14_3_00_36_14]PJA10194.1 MAG: D-alanine--D-alanine ligase [Candidatus Falkowbacteria bacterium CG_4_10_14_0_2_um_filter_36_22]PJB19367.1 MAG: D-alanine--D-alanine ligase [Candidatus Falkowbacteria bacterium CG_4_9_14_3_um_filter_36_9]